MKARCLAHCLVLSLATAAWAQSTAFTYQGRLTSGGNPASGPHDMQLRLFDAASGGAQVGFTLCFDSVQVAAGLFSLQLDFGQQFASPAARFLEIQVRPEIGQPCADQFAYVTLTPRQALTATPLANHAKSAFSLDAADGSPLNALIVDNAGRTGVGTTAPTHSVHIATVGPTIALQDTNAASQQAGYVSYRDDANVERAWVGYGTPGDPDFSIINARTSGDIVLNPFSGNVVLGNAGTVIVDPAGNVAIGTTTPGIGRLHVDGGRGLFTNSTGGDAVAGLCTAMTGSGVGIYGYSQAPGGAGVYGEGTAAGTTTGVYGRVLGGTTSSAVHAEGRFTATGTKSFRIDHPADPQRKYLFHYCAESDEVINFYSGKAVLDDGGGATIELPSYFAAINSDPRYTLTPLGAAMPLLHIAAEIDEGALKTGNAVAPGEPIPACSFRIAGGVPGARVSWRVDAVRSDRWVLNYGAPVEVEKIGPDIGTYQHPEFYGEPEEKRLMYRPGRTKSNVDR